MEHRGTGLWRRCRAGIAGSLAVVLLTVGLVGVPGAAAAVATRRPLTNLAHLDFLTTRVTPPRQAGHTTYRMGSDPSITTLWVYATALGGGGFTRVGGGAYDAVTRTYGQGAFDADDMARAAVVYLEHWREFGDAASRNHARELLRGVTYLQDASGPDAGNVVLWMQPDGTLQPSATPADTPDPSDSGSSYWLARTIWALGTGYADFRSADPAFARFLAAREDLAVRALDRESLSHYPRTVTVDGRHRPAWLITGGADASAEAVLGLDAYVSAGGGSLEAGRLRARRALAELSRGIAAMASGNAWTWPYGAVLPAVTSISEWHAWAGLAPAALAHASATLADPRYLRVAEADAVTFTSHLLIQGGPDDSWAPAPVDTSQIAYGADSRVESLQALTDVTHEPADARLTGLAASWFFGNNAAGSAVYDPRTGVTADGISAVGVINPSSGAESTIHGLLTMLALDRDPIAAAVARSATVTHRTTDHLVEAESGALSGKATVLTPADPTTGESQWSGGAYVELGVGGRLTLTTAVPAGSLLMAVTRFLPGSAATRWAVAGNPVGTVHQGRIGARGASPWPGALEVSTLASPDGGRVIDVSTVGPGSAAVDAVLVQPAVESLQLTGRSGAAATTLVRSFARHSRVLEVALGAHGRAVVDVFDAAGLLVSSTMTGLRHGAVRVVLPAGGTALLTRD
jgi:hypothetical protein